MSENETKSDVSAARCKAECPDDDYSAVCKLDAGHGGKHECGNGHKWERCDEDCPKEGGIVRCRRKDGHSGKHECANGHDWD